VIGMESSTGLSIVPAKKLTQHLLPLSLPPSSLPPHLTGLATIVGPGATPFLWVKTLNDASVPNPGRLSSPPSTSVLKAVTFPGVFCTSRRSEVRPSEVILVVVEEGGGGLGVNSWGA